MPRAKVDRGAIFRLLALNWEKSKIKKEMKIGEATYWRAKADYDKLSDTEKEEISRLATTEEKAKEKFMDYEFVQKWVQRMQSERIKSWRRRFNNCKRIWEILQKKDPQNWTEDDIKLRAIPELRKTSKSVFDDLISVRSLRPDLKDTVKTKREKAPITFEWKYVYERMMSQNKLEPFLKAGGFKHELIKKLHVTLGCREGQAIGGILGLEWNKVNWENKTIDVFEGKTGGGFYWLNCPLDLLGNRTFEMLQQYWNEQGKPTEGKIFGDITYNPIDKNKECLRDIYRQATEAIGELYGHGGITPHFARKLHASLLIDRDVPLEMVAGDKPFGIMGVGWEDLTTLKKYYLAFRKAKIEENRNKARTLNL